MNICLQNREYPPHGLVVGPSTFYHTLGRALVARGHRVHVICQGPGTDGTRSEDGVIVHEVGTRIRRGDPFARIDYAVRAWLALRRIIKDDHIDVIDTQFYPAEGLLYSFRKGPAALAIQAHAWGEMMMYRGLWLNSLLRMETVLEHITARRADLIIAPSQAAYKHIVEVVGVPRQRVLLLPVTSTVDTEVFRPVGSDYKERLGMGADDFLLLCVGRLEARKGLHMLCEAMPIIYGKFPQAKFVLVGQDTKTSPGGGSFRDYILAYAHRHGLSAQIHFLQDLPQKELVALFSACDLFVFPSLRENDGAPPLQAMACGRPVVATATSVSVDLSQGGPGVAIVPAGNPQELARAVFSFLALSAQERAAAGMMNRQLVEERFSFDITADRLVEAYVQAKVVAQSRASR